MGYTKDDVWNKGYIAGKNDPNVWRKDDCNAWMKYDDYGDTNSEYGWEIDHITSLDHNGKNILSNVRPLQWQNNRSKSSGRLKCAVTAADGKHNTECN